MPHEERSGSRACTIKVVAGTLINNFVTFLQSEVRDVVQRRSVEARLVLIHLKKLNCLHGDHWRFHIQCDPQLSLCKAPKSVSPH